METSKMLQVARQAVATAQKKGAKQAAATGYRSRDIEVNWRDGRLEKLHEATTAGLSLRLHVDGRYSSVSTSDLRPEAVDTFIENAVAMARALAKDAFRSLPDPKLYDGQAKLDLQLEDPDYATVTALRRRQIAESMEEAARQVKGAEVIVSVEASYSDRLTESFQVHSNGFEGHKRGTEFWVGADVSVKDPDGRKPQDWDYRGTRFVREIPDPIEVGRRAALNALARIGSKKNASGLMGVAIDPRAGGSFVSQLQRPLSAAELQQKSSMFEGKLGLPIGSIHLDVADDPHVVKGFGSQLYDLEGIAAKRTPIFEAGVLKNFYVDHYYGKKLGMAPTTGRPSNVVFKLGLKSQAELLKEMKDGLLVTSFLGGNANATTGDFSVGIFGFRVRNGQLAEPVSEMNIAGNHLEIWKHLVAVGNDPYPHSALRTPTLVFEKVAVAGV